VAVARPALWPWRKAQSATCGSKPWGGSAGGNSWSAASVTSTSAWPPKWPCTAAAPSATTCELSSAAESSRVSSKSDRARRSRLVDTPAAKRRPAVSWPTSRPTPSMIAKVSTYCTSLTAKDMRGGTKK
jgi:hypothetical protein